MSENSNRICVHFEVPVKTFFNEVNNRLVQREIVSVVLWIYVKLSNRISDEKQLRIKVEGANLSRKSIKFHLKSLK